MATAPKGTSNFCSLVRQLLAQGVAPTPTAFARRGWPYVKPANVRHYARNRQPVANPGSGTTWTHGRYAAARRAVLLAYGWRYVPNTNSNYPEMHGRWVPPNS